MAAKKKEVVLQVSSSQAFCRLCKFSVSAKDGVQSWGIRFCWQSTTVRSLWGRGIPGDRWEAWEDLAGHMCPQSGLWGAEGTAAGLQVVFGAIGA